jgi:hypothetical protein
MKTTAIIPIRTYSRLNSRISWKEQAKRSKAERSAAKWYLFDIEPFARFADFPRWTVTLTRRGPTQGLDSDNLSAAMKSCRDGVADWMGAQDNDPRIEWKYKQERAKDWSVVIEVEPREVN